MKGKILVTGGTGYIGSHSTVELQNAGYEVVIIDNPTLTSKYSMESNVSQANVLRSFKPTVPIWRLCVSFLKRIPE